MTDSCVRVMVADADVRPGSTVSGWLRTAHRRPVDPAARLICLAHAGGGATAFQSWLRRSTTELEVVAVQLPGHGDRLLEPPRSDLDALADTLVTELSGELDRPYALYGHSMGAGLAVTVAQRLAQRPGPRQPASLLVGACLPPHQPTDPAWQCRSDCPDSELVDWVRRLGGTSEDVLSTPDLLALVLPVLRADLRLTESWRAGHRTVALPHPVRAFAGSTDPVAPPTTMLGWAAESAEGFSLTTIPGGHFFATDGAATVLATARADLAAPGRLARSTA